MVLVSCRGSLSAVNGVVMPKDLTNLSRLVSRALRHEPWVFELELDEQGWADSVALLAALRDRSGAWADLSRDDLAEMIRTSPKQRHEMVGGKIRAIYGHSLPGIIKRAPSEPPLRLFHGTTPATLPKIHAAGLLPMGRQYVHLSADYETATAVGLRKSTGPAILVVRAHEAWKSGVAFYHGNEKVWLADAIYPEFINLG